MHFQFQNSWILNYKFTHLFDDACELSTWAVDEKVSLDETWSPIPVVPGLEILGAWIALRDTTTHAVTHRLAAASKAFWANAHLLRDTARPLHRRLADFYSCGGRSVVYTSGAWRHFLTV